MSGSVEGTLQEVGEFGLIHRIAGDVSDSPHVLLGPGDDAAIVRAPDGRVVASVDVLVEGVHFRRDWSTPVDIGRKAAAASLADIVAMGAVPTALLVGFGAPGDLPAPWAVQCTAGMQSEAASLDAVIVGGDVVAADRVVLSVTALGDLGGAAPVLRSGARPGDVVAVAGRLGWSAAGLAVLTRGFRSPKALVDAHRFPQPPYQAGLAAARSGATAMIDVSDGLVADARHLAEESGVLVRLQSATVVIDPQVASTAAAFNVDPREWVMTGGEDHAFLATFAAGAEVPPEFIVVGVVAEVGSRGAGVEVDGHFIGTRGGHEHFR